MVSKFSSEMAKEPLIRSLKIQLPTDDGADKVYHIQKLKEPTSKWGHILKYIICVVNVLLLCLLVWMLGFFAGSYFSRSLLSKNQYSEQSVGQHMIMETLIREDTEKFVKNDDRYSEADVLEIEEDIEEKAVNAQCNIDEDKRFDCWPERDGASEEGCNSRGCCWKPASHPYTAPWCFFSLDYPGYMVTQLNQTNSGMQLLMTRDSPTFFKNDVMTLQLSIEYLSAEILRLKFFDPKNKRFEVPMKLNYPKTSRNFTPLYNVTIYKSPFNILVTRAKNGEAVFDSRNTAPLIFSDQYLQFGTILSTKYLYGLGEHRSEFLQRLDTWRRLSYWNRDRPPTVDVNGYGTHPFYLNLESSQTSSNGASNAHGVLLLNSNAGEVALQPMQIAEKTAGGLTFRAIGGILDFYIVLGPEPLSVVNQYTNLIGRPYLPPFWSLGFHICKYGYNSSDAMKTVIQRNREAQMPYDVQWTDIDAMEARKDWTYDKNKFADLPAIVKDLKENKQRYINIIDPAIASSVPAGTYPPFDDGKQLDVFIKNSDGEILIGKVWPGETAFPDFFHPSAFEYWYKQAKRFHDIIPYDGLWIDMNEPSNFVDGSTKGCSPSSFNNPPFVPPSISDGLIAKTICPSAKQYLSTHYDLHNMYGWSESNVTRDVLTKLFPNKRSVLITRSSFVGAGRYTGHWTGDNDASFEDMRYSIPGILNFNLLGIPQIGADICGFRDKTTDVLCTRWHQLGVFYPFMRNHADISSSPQDPASFNSPYRDYIREALQMRYTLLAVLYNAFYDAHINGNPIVRPLFFLYPGTESIDQQFMWTDQLLISPVLTDGATSVQAYIPKDIWYDFYTGQQLQQTGTTVKLDAPLNKINVHVRGGSILPLLPPTERTDVARQQKFNLYLAPNASGQASGFLFWDDGESSDSISANKYSLIRFNFKEGTLTNQVEQSGYKPDTGIRLTVVRFSGVKSSPTKVLVNGQEAQFGYDPVNKSLTVFNLDVDLLSALTISYE